MKSATELKLDWSGYYSSRLGVNMYPLKTGECSLVYDLHFSSSSIDSSTVQISVSNIFCWNDFKSTTNVFSDHSRSIIHINKYSNVAPNRLIIDMVLKNKSGIAYANDLTAIFIVVYGVKGYHNDVDSSDWDRVY